MDTTSAGFREVEHTADWELQVWAPDLPGLLEQAARGMYALSGTRLAGGTPVVRSLVLPLNDGEALLVQFLSELLWIGEKDGLGFSRYELRVTEGALQAQITGASIVEQAKEIKAVTFHRLQIREPSDGGLEVNIVFDV